MDGEIGHLRENITFPLFDDVFSEKRTFGGPDSLHFGGETIPPMSAFGRGSFVHVTGSTHKPTGMRDVSTRSVHDELVTRLCGKISDAREEICMVEEDYDEGANGSRFGVLAYGATARPAKGAVIEARNMGAAVDFLRLITLWPFPVEAVKKLAERVDKILVPEMNLGQISREVERFTAKPVIPVSKIGGAVHTVEEIRDLIR
jgi:2-oxoglutarate ferredoxin oxidoreductase subunit alpha